MNDTVGLIHEAVRYFPRPDKRCVINVDGGYGTSYGDRVDIVADVPTSLCRFEPHRVKGFHWIEGRESISKRQFAEIRSVHPLVDLVGGAMRRAFEKARDSVHEMGLRIIDIHDTIVRAEELEMLGGMGI